MHRTMIALLGLAAVAAAAAPETFTVEFQTDIKSGDGKITMNVTRAWAPIGVDRFYELLGDKFFDGAAFFRVVPGFVLQFGIAGVPAENAKWDKPIKDDPVVKSNLETYVSYATAGPNTRTTQLFINYVDNQGLDGQGFAPFAKVIGGMSVATAVHNPGNVPQGEYTHKGNSWITQQYPGINFITSAKITHKSA